MSKKVLSLSLSVELDEKEYKDMMARATLFGKNINKALASAYKRAASAGKAETKRQLSSEYTLPSTEIGKTITSKATSKEAWLRISSSAIPIIKFKGVAPKTVMPPTKGPVKAEIKKGEGGTLKRAFVAKMKAGDKFHIGVFERESEKRKSKDTAGNEDAKSKAKWHINEHFGPATPGMLKENDAARKAVISKMKETLNTRVKHELGRLLNA